MIISNTLDFVYHNIGVINILFSIFIIYLIKYSKHAIGTQYRRDLKEPGGVLPFIGHLKLFASVKKNEYHQFYEEMYNKLGPVWSITLPLFGRFIQIDTPENVEHVLSKNFYSYEKGQLMRAMLGDLFGNGFFLLDGEDWRVQRKLANKVFVYKGFLDVNNDIFVVNGKKVLKFLGKAADEGTIVEFHDLFVKYTLDCFSEISFGESYGCLDNLNEEKLFIRAFEVAIKMAGSRMTNPFFKLSEYRSGEDVKWKNYKKELYQYYNDKIQTRRKTRVNDRNDLLQEIFKAEAEDGETMLDDLIRDFMIVLTLAGQQSMANVMTWMFYTLYNSKTDQDVLRNLVKEIDGVLEGSEPTVEQVKKMKYTQACINETCRMFPPLGRNMKNCVQDDVLPDGTVVNKGDWISWCAYAMGLSEAIWGSDAKVYKPSRWIGTTKPSQGKFIAFNAGPRLCPGQKFALTEGTIITSMILQAFELEPVDHYPDPVFTSDISLTLKGGLKFRVKRRVM